MVVAVVVSLVELIGYHLFRKPKPKFAWEEWTTLQRLSLLHWNTATLLTCSTDNVRSVSTQRLGGPVQTARGKLVIWQKKTNRFAGEELAILRNVNATPSHLHLTHLQPVAGVNYQALFARDGLENHLISIRLVR